MIYKIVKNSIGEVVGYGENVEEYQPVIPLGGSIEISDQPPPYSQSQLDAIAKSLADKIESDLAKADVVSQYIKNHTIAEIENYVKTNVNAIGVTNLATAIAALVKIENLLVKLAILHKIKE